MPASPLVPLFEAMLGRRWTVLGALLAFTALFGALAQRVRPDYSIEMAFPRFEQSRTDYDRYKRDFPFEDATALVVVEAPDIFTPNGLRRIAALEADLARIAGVVDTQGLTTVRDIVSDGATIRTDLLVPRPGADTAPLDASRFADLGPEPLAAIKRTATSAPLFVWSLASPDGRATTIQVTLSPQHASNEAMRTQFLHRARDVIARHEASARAAGQDQRLTLSGLPVIRSEFTELIAADLARLFPVALLVILIVLYVSFRSIADVAAALLAIAFSVVWTLGVMGWSGVPLQVLTQITPIIVMVVSISDTAHIITHYRLELAARGDRPASTGTGEAPWWRGATTENTSQYLQEEQRGQPGRIANRMPRDRHHGLLAHVATSQAIAGACAASALPCLLTEITIAAGFCGLAFNDIVMIQQFGLVTAAGAMLAWLANMVVLPLALSFAGARRSHSPARRPPRSRTAIDRLILAIEHAVIEHPGRIAGVASIIVVAALLLAPRIGRQYYAYDDLRASGALFQNLRRVEAAFGGTVPLAIFVEPAVGREREANGMLEPDALALVDRITQRLEANYPHEIRNVASISEYLRKAHRLFAGDDSSLGALPATRRLAAQELTAVDEPRLLRNLVSTDRSTAAVFAMVPDHGSTRASTVIRELRSAFDAEERTHPYRITITGIYGLADGIYRSLVGGLARSLGWAMVISFAVFCLVLRSVRLALIALVPNLLPLLLTAAIMSLLGIDLKPTTVVIFSIALVIADDDTIQFLSRFRVRYAALARAAHPAAHRQAALETLRESGTPMFVTALSVAAGFSALMLSEFVGLANLGLLFGVTLFAAFFADAFLTPLLLISLRPRIAVRGGESTAAPS